jgi:glucuronoarabinoxylan endo-1,4-beta-xylanase
VLDLLYCVNATDPGCSGLGIGLTLLRRLVTGISGEADPDGLGVVARGGKVWGSPWGGPCGAPVDQWVTAIKNWTQSEIAQGVPILGISGQNEPDNGGGSIGCYIDPNTYASHLAAMGPVLHAINVKVMGAETISPGAFFQPGYYRDTIEGNSAANAATDIFTSHQYYPWTASYANDGTRPLWETEVCCQVSTTFDPSISDALNNTATEMYDAIVTVGANAWHQWWLIYSSTSPADGNPGLLGSSGQHNGFWDSPVLTKRYFATGNWSRYVRPGWVRIGVSGSRSGFYGVTAFKDPASGNFAIVAINNSGSDISNVTFGVSGSNICGSVTPYVTSGTPIGPLGMDGNLSAGSASSNVPSSLPVSGGKFISTVPYGVTTFVGKAGC